MTSCQDLPPPGTQRGLGRLAAVDERDRRFSMSAPRTDRTFRNWLSPPFVPWDQGQTSECVSYAANRWLTSHRVVNEPPMGLHEFYKECQRNDEWPGESYEGTSVRAAFRVLQRLGLVSTYTWATDVEQIVRHVLEVGPVVMGTDWTDGMFRPDRHGYIWPTGGLAGGHAWKVSAVNLRRRNPDETEGALRCYNSWGPGWGQKGKAWVALHVVEKLLEGISGWPGDACTADEVRVR